MDASSAPAGRAGTETRGLSQGGAVDASSAPAGRAEIETRGSSQGGAVDASSTPEGRAESETRGLSQGGAVDASWVPAEMDGRELSAASTSGIDQEKGEDAPAVLLGRAAHELRDWGRPHVSAGPDPGSETTPGRVNPVVADALMAAAYELSLIHI